MGGAADLPQRSSSPLKRPASDLEAEPESSQNDVDMVAVPELAASEPTEASIRPTQPGRTQSVDMIRGETNDMQAQATAPDSRPKTDLPPIDVQIKTVTAVCEAADEKQLEEGDIAYLVSKRWLDRVTSRGSEARQKSKTEPEGEIGPVDNSDIIRRSIKDHYGAEFVQLKDGVGMESFETFPEEAWNMIVEWYGLMPGQKAITRTARNTNWDKFGVPNIQYELHPPVFVIHRLWSDPANSKAHLLPVPLKVRQPSAPKLVLSRTEKYVDFLKKIKNAAGVKVDRKIRVWRVPRLQPAAEPVAPVVNTVTPPASPSNSDYGNAPIDEDPWPQLLLDVPTFVKLPMGEGREKVDIDDHSVNEKYNGSSDLAFSGLGDSQSIVIDEWVCREDYVSTYFPKDAQKSNTANRAGALVPQSNSQPNSGRNSPAPSGPMTRGRSQRNGRTPGTVGLSNLGNTCYMNSALQCVRSVPELTKYFLSGAALREINTDNPLGNNGEVAKAYYQLLIEIYNTKNTSVAPRNFKNTIGRYAPSFSGYGQQDSQEFLGFLLDGLQEDLSRVKKKPYIEKPDSTDEMVNDPEAIREMAAKVWDITKKRDDSVIADLFTGMYKSTLVCPECAKVSITFDPFNNLTLQLPIENSWSHPVYFFPLNDKPVIINVDIDKQATILAMKHYLSKKVDVPVERLCVAEEFKSKFYKIHKNYDVASEDIGSNDSIAVYELEAKPTNWPIPNNDKTRKLKYGDDEDVPSWDSPLAERMLVPVFYRRPNNERSRYGSKKSWEVMPVPHFIIVTPEEARSEDLIRRKILEKVATFTTHSAFNDDDENTSESVAESIDPELVHTTGSDSSGDSKVVANSVDGEDGLVDVSMKESNSTSEPVDKEAVKRADADPSNLLNFNKRRPKFLEPGTWLPGEFQNLFDLCYLSGSGKELIPTGWNVLDEDKAYPRLASRNPQVSQNADELDDDFEMTNGRAASHSSNEDSDSRIGTLSGTTRMVDEEESDEDELASGPAKVLPVRPAAPKSGVRGIRQARKLSSTPDFEQDAPDDGPLIRLGEGIVVDWNQEAFQTMFEGTSPEDTLRGQSTWSSIPTYEDVELAAKKSARAQRQKHGITLDDCLNEFGKEEVLSEMDTWYCPRCKEHRRATKKFELWKTPDILIMHLKRFSSSGFRRDKLDVLVDFPIDNLDLTSRVIETENGKSEVYDLIAVDDHWGGLGGGHYTAFAKNFDDQKWYEYNDSSVSEVKDVKRVVSSAAYLLFYRRRSDHMLGGPKLQELINENTENGEPEFSEDDELESGEGQGLDAKSSLRGSSSALTGVGAAHRAASGSGIGTGTNKTTVDPQELDALPAYQAHETEDDGAHLLREDAEMNSGLGIRTSIEDDEGIGMEYNQDRTGFNSANQGSTWNWGQLDGPLINRQFNRVSRSGSEIDCNANSGFDTAGSDVVQHDSSADADSLRGRIEDFDNAIPMDDDGVMFEDPSPVPDVDDENQVDTLALHRDLIANRQPQFQVHAPDDEENDEPAAEIHLDASDDLELKMD